MIIRGKYEILEKIGAGGMAWVYRARHLVFDEIRAIKILRSWMADDEDFVRRLKSEAVIARRLKHPNAVMVDDIDNMEDGRPFIVMEYVKGTDIRTVLQNNGPMPHRRVINIACQVLDALQAAHALGITHRDIKPDNILLVAERDGSDLVKVLDFGIAKIREADSSMRSGTKTGFIICTPEYASPEQARASRQVDGRSDLYSLGIVIYEMLTGSLPFHADSQFGMLLHQINTQPAPPHESNPNLRIPPALSAVVMRALEKNPEDRFQTASEMLSAIERVDMDGRPSENPVRTSPRVQAIRRLPADEPFVREEREEPPPPPPPPRNDDAACETSAHYLLEDDEPKRRPWLWAALLAALAIIAASVYFVPSLLQHRTVRHVEERPQVTDAEIADKVKAALAPLAARGAELSVEVHNGVVGLSGNAPSQEVEREARQVAMQASGLAVSSDIDILPSKPQVPDKQVRSEIPDGHILEDLNRVLSSLGPQGAHIKAAVTGGEATLTGDAADPHTIALAANSARQVPGVVSVVNDIQVATVTGPKRSPRSVSNTVPSSDETAAASSEPPSDAAVDRQVKHLIAKARQFRKADKLGQALSVLDKALALAPDNLEAQQLQNDIEKQQTWEQENEGAVKR